CSPGPGACEGELRLGRIDALRFDRRAALDELLGESPVAAAHVDPPLARGGRQPIEEDRPHELAPGAHHALVGCSIIESNGLLDHWRRPPLITGFYCRETWIRKMAGRRERHVAWAVGAALGCRRTFGRGRETQKCSEVQDFR